MFFDNLHIENPSATTDPVLVIKKEKGMKFEKVGNELGVKFGYGADKINDFNKEIEELKKYLEEKRIGTAIHYPIPIHLVPSLKYLGYKKGDFPTAEMLSEEILSLPMFPEIKEEEIRYVCREIENFYSSQK